VRRFWLSLLLLLVSSVTTASLVHAREIPGPVTIECSGTVHQDGDADQTSGDQDKATPHHHGSCHASGAHLPASGGNGFALTGGSMLPTCPGDALLGSTIVDPAFRPPAA